MIFDLGILPGLDLLDGIDELVDLGPVNRSEFSPADYPEKQTKVSDWLRAESLALRLVARLGDRLDERIAQCTKAYARYGPLYRHVHEGLDAGTRVADVAKLMQMSPDHLTRVFQADTGMSVKQYLSQQLFQKAASFLAFENLRVKEIAAALKFRDVHEFTRFFHKAAGITPTAYRALHRRD
jgi:AraC-like DNA-binding protein